MGVALALAIVSLAGCGFQPLYGDAGATVGTAEAMATVEVAPIPNRVGQLVRNRLLERLNVAGETAPEIYRLEVVLEESLEDLAIEPDDTATRTNLRLNASFALREIASDEIVYRGMARIISAYTLVRADYANLIAERDARARAAREIADEIQTRVAVFLSRRVAAK